MRLGLLKPKVKNLDQLYCELKVLMYKQTIIYHLEKSQAKPPRRKPKRNADYLAEQANGLFMIKPGQIFVNPTDSQLDRIYDGQLWGYKA